MIYTLWNIFLKIFTDSYIYQFFSYLLGSLWEDSAGRIFLSTVLLSLFGALVYSGYISRFLGGVGSISFSRMGFQITDLITIIPVAVITIIEVLQKMFFDVVKWIFIAVSYVFACFSLGVLISFLLRTYIFVYSPIPVIICFLSWYIGLLSVYFSRIIDFKRRRFVFLLGSVCQILGIAFFPVDSSVASQIQQINQPPSVVVNLIHIVYLSISNFTSFMSLLALLIAPYALGTRMADSAIREDMLSELQSLVLKQPLLHLGEYREINTKTSDKTVSWANKWFNKNSISVSVEPDTYHYVFGDKKWLIVALFNDICVIFRHDDLGQRRIVMINKEIILSMEVSSSVKSKSPLIKNSPQSK